jgi:UDP-N-acetylmuramoylalanine--D-glutamate ligase
LIIGGSDEKKSDFTILNDSIEKYCKFILTVGEAARHITNELNSDKVAGQFTIEEALDIALEKGTDGDTILFSPGCPSFDRFENYKERGRFFWEIVNEKN